MDDEKVIGTEGDDDEDEMDDYIFWAFQMTIMADSRKREVLENKKGIGCEDEQGVSRDDDDNGDLPNSSMMNMSFWDIKSSGMSSKNGQQAINSSINSLKVSSLE